MFKDITILDAVYLFSGRFLWISSFGFIAKCNIYHTTKTWKTTNDWNGSKLNIEIVHKLVRMMNVHLFWTDFCTISIFEFLPFEQFDAFHVLQIWQISLFPIDPNKRIHKSRLKKSVFCIENGSIIHLSTATVLKWIF